MILTKWKLNFIVQSCAQRQSCSFVAQKRKLRKTSLPVIGANLVPALPSSICGKVIADPNKMSSLWKERMNLRARFADVIASKIYAVLFDFEDDYFAKEILASLLSVDIVRLFGLG
jgi:hypothetical protein